jgi:hypothetical protein
MDQLLFDGTSEEFAWWSGLPIPYGLSVVADLGLWVAWHPASGSGDVKWGFLVQSEGNGDAVPGASSSEATIVDTATGTTVVMSIIELAGAQIVPGELMQVRLARKAADAADTLNGIDAVVVGVALLEL